MAPGRIRDSVTFACGLALVGVLGGCTSDAMEPLNDLDPITIDELVIDPTAIREGGAVVVYAVPEAGQVASPPQANLIQVNVRTSSGESATLRLRPRTCTLSDGTRYICDTFYVGMKPGWHVADIAVHTRRVHGVFSRVLGDGEHASIRILKGDLHAAMRQAASWPGVRFVELGGFFCLANGSGCGDGLEGALAITFGGQRTGNGPLRVEPGDTLVVEYRQPDGSSLERSIVIR